MNYVISGFERSGTSAIMGAFVACGIMSIVSKAREKKMRLTNTLDYTVNKHGFYEVGSAEYMRFGFSSELPQECCVKIMTKGLPILAPSGGYKIILMRRHPSLIKESYINAFNENEFNRKYPDWPTHYWKSISTSKAIMQERRDVELLEVQFDEMIDNPLKVFTQIKAMGVPIDINKAVATIEPELRRYGNL